MRVQAIGRILLKHDRQTCDPTEREMRTRIRRKRARQLPNPRWRPLQREVHQNLSGKRGQSRPAPGSRWRSASRIFAELPCKPVARSYERTSGIVAPEPRSTPAFESCSVPTHLRAVRRSTQDRGTGRQKSGSCGRRSGPPASRSARLATAGRGESLALPVPVRSVQANPAQVE